MCGQFKVNKVTFLVASALTLSLFGCGETGGVYGGSSWPIGGGGLTGSDYDVATRGIFADGEVTDAEYDQYLAAVEERVAQKPFVPAPWSHQLTGDESQNVDVYEDSLVFPSETLQPGDPGYDPSNPLATAPPKYKVNDILVSANYSQNKVFLRKVTSVSEQVNGTVYETRNAAITEAVFQGNLSEAPTELSPSYAQQYIHHQQMLAYTFSISDINVARGLEYSIGVSSRGENGSAGLNFNVSQPRLTNLDVPVRLDAEIRSDWLGRVIDRNHTIPSNDGSTTRTSCGTVTESLNFAKGTDQDSQNCQRAMSTWESSPNYPAIPDSVRSIEGITVLRSGGAPRIACNDSKDWWPDSTVLMPLPHEVAWAQANCGGVLESFEFASSFEPRLVVDNVSISATAEASDSNDTERMCDNCQISKSKTFFIGWFPVVLKLQGEVIGKAYDVGFEGIAEAGVRDISVGFDLNLELSYNQQNGPVSSRSSWHLPAPTLTPQFSGEWFAEGSARGHAEHQIAGLRTSLYFYDLAGPYFIPVDTYARADAQIATTAAQIDGEFCNIGLTAGFRTSAGLAGKIPFTNADANNWEFFSYDSCVLDLENNPDETRLHKDFLERDSSYCLKKCVSSTPLFVAINWDVDKDIDLQVRTPDGQVFDRNNSRGLDPKFSNTRGCSTNETCYVERGGSNQEYVTWLAQDPTPGTYTVQVKNHSDSAVSFESVVRADTDAGEPILNERQQRSVAPDETAEFTFILPN